MSDRIVFPDIHVVNPMFAIPDGLTGYTYGRDDLNLLPADTGEDTSDGLTDDSSIVDEVSPFDDDSGGAEDVYDLQVIQQIIRFAATGQQVVDLIVEVDGYSTDEYEFKVAKV